MTRRSIEGLNSDERLADSDEEEQGKTSLNMHVDSNPSLVGSAARPISPGGQPPLQSSAPVSPTGLSPASHQVVKHSPPSQSHIRPSSPKPQSPTKKAPHYHFPWPDSRAAPDHRASNGHSKENKSIVSFDAKDSFTMVSGDHKDTKEPKESTLETIGNFLFGSKPDHDRDRRSIHGVPRQQDVPWSATAMIGGHTNCLINL